MLESTSSGLKARFPSSAGLLAPPSRTYPLGHCTCCYQRLATLTASCKARFPSSLFWPVSCSVSCSLYLCTWYTRAKRRRPGAMAHKNRTTGRGSFALDRLQDVTWADFSVLLGHWRRIKNPCIFCIAPKGQKSKNQWPLVASRSDFGSISNDFGSHVGIDF